MTKVGNEARLILRLAEERMDKKVAAKSEASYTQAFRDYKAELQSIVSELEDR